MGDGMNDLSPNARSRQVRRAAVAAAIGTAIEWYLGY
jgi:hypothetical protein